MCSCNFKPASVYYNISSKSISTCEGKATTLSNERNRVAILFNITTDSELKSSYKELKSQIESLINSIYKDGNCPESELISEITKEIDYEYSKYYNSK
jgi:hypothetical protein